MPRPTARKAVGVTFIVIAVLMLAAAGWLVSSYLSARTDTASQQAATKVAVPTQTVTIKPETVTGTPTKIEVSSVGISQPVERGEYDANTGKWTLSYHAAYWGSTTAPINSQTGNTFIYGHDVPEIFGNLLKAKVGDKALVTTDNGYVFTYTLRESVAVDPTDTSKLQPTDAPTLTVQTCSGSWYQYRQMFTFTLDGYKKIQA